MYECKIYEKEINQKRIGTGGAPGETRTLTSDGQQILSLPRLPFRHRGPVL